MLYYKKQNVFFVLILYVSYTQAGIVKTIIYNAFFLSGIFQNTDKSYLLYSVQ